MDVKVYLGTYASTYVTNAALIWNKVDLLKVVVLEKPSSPDTAQFNHICGTMSKPPYCPRKVAIPIARR